MPAPWVPFTRAGCDVGAVASANIVLENTGTGATGDVTKVFGTGSPQFAEATASARGLGHRGAQPGADRLRRLRRPLRAGLGDLRGRRTDILPQEPGGYTGFKGLFGAQQINPLLTGQPARPR